MRYPRSATILILSIAGERQPKRRSRDVRSSAAFPGRSNQTGDSAPLDARTASAAAVASVWGGLNLRFLPRSYPTYPPSIQSELSCTDAHRSTGASFPDQVAILRRFRPENGTKGKVPCSIQSAIFLMHWNACRRLKLRAILTIEDLISLWRSHGFRLPAKKRQQPLCSQAGTRSIVIRLTRL
jgi:hypothetical protein